MLARGSEEGLRHPRRSLTLAWDGGEGRGLGSVVNVEGMEWSNSRASWRAVLTYWCRSGRDVSVGSDGWAGMEVKGWEWSWIRGIVRVEME